MVDIRLVDYIKQGFKKGYTSEELQKILKENGWSSVEISESLNSVQKTKKVSSPLTKKKNHDKILLSFINQNLEKGFPEQQIKQALMAKNWPEEKIDDAFSRATRPKPKIEEKKVEKIKPKPKKVMPQFDTRKILWHLLWFFVIGLILTTTVGVFYYVKEMSNFTIIDPDTGNEVKGYCLEEDCSDMRGFVQNELMNSLIIILTIALSIALVITIIHYFIPNKEMFIWVMNILFFFFICFILYTWFSTYNKTFLN
ncbi:hypothetical protein HOG16_03260 [Candidatus Woesearchaeota archaeon]|jgi:SOS response regulatory protein OraA/RecX|nr:hypothetical protein [Candidatus Woesearchaeota archaeon]MBT4322341.1 hypothetical protein [Candidatus Woesearchaeota archaeon]MBT4630959.1 hypothetical protein [Candidatus Woesearchaeota archaeon]